MNPSRFHVSRIRRLFLFALNLLGLVSLAANSLRAEGTLTVSASPGGRLHLTCGEDEIRTFSPLVADGNWAFFRAKAEGDVSSNAFFLPIGTGMISGELKAGATNGAVEASWALVAQNDVAFQTLAVATDYEVSELAGGRWEAGGQSGVFPAQFDKAHIFNGEVRRLVITPAKGPAVVISFPNPTMVLLQDNRQWGNATFSLRIGRGAGRLAAGEKSSIVMTVEGAIFSAATPAALQPVVLRANDEWIPLREELEIAPGSALDLSYLVEGPCGRKGRVIVNANGKFACAEEPGRPLRFYGVNLCFSAQYLSHAETDRLLDRLVRLGYNSVRLHHYESGLMKSPDDGGFDWDPEKVDQLDYLMAGCARRGLWLTTDLYTSRPVGGTQIGLAEGRVEMDRYKLLLPVHEAAFRDWTVFARKFLDRVNPHTGLRIADDPALAWISLVNEGPLANNWSAIRQMPQWQDAWNAWLAMRYPSRKQLGASLGDLTQAESPELRSVAMPADLSGDALRSQVAAAFVADMERQTYAKMRDFLRRELKCEALLTNMNNAGSTSARSLMARESFDYVDEHFYVDHPQFLEKPWRLPSFCPNTNPIASGAQGGMNVAVTRLYGKPFTITEYNYSSPGRFRGVGGILTGALAALQDWDGVWRFAYSHNKANLFEPGPIHYFDLSSDPLNLAADRLTLFLYLRQDLTPAATRVTAVLEEGGGGSDAQKRLSALRPFGWTTQIGCFVKNTGQSVPDSLTNIAKLESHGAGEGQYWSETREIVIVPNQSLLLINTPRSAGGYAEPGGLIESPSLRVDQITTGATVFVSSLDQARLGSSRRLLVTHLTDLQNTGAHYGEGARQTLLDWGGLPHLVRDGSARVSLALPEPESLSVWALSPGGRRVEKIASSVEGKRLVFIVSVKGAEGARMLYEIATK